MADSRGVALFSPNNPDVPYFAIKIEDRIYDIEYNYIENLSVRRTWDDVGEFSFSIVNFMDLNLENKFCELFVAYTTGAPPISFQYGWSLGDKSQWYRGFLVDYSTTFLPGGYSKISVSGKLVGESASTERVATYKGKSVTDIVAQIAEDLGWIIEDMDQSVPFSMPRSFTVSNIGTIDYIRKELEPIAVTTKNEPFRFYAETQNANDTHIWFISVNKKVSVQQTYNFFYNLGNYGSVLEWSPKYSGRTMAGYLQTAVFDLDTNDICVYGNEAPASVAGGASLTVYGATSPDRMGAMLANKWYQNNIGTLTASLMVVGDPKLKPYMSVNVLPMMADGKLHRYTSGTYQIREINDEISGTFTTSMELVMLGDEDGSKTLPLAEVVEFRGSE